MASTIFDENLKQVPVVKLKCQVTFPLEYAPLCLTHCRTDIWETNENAYNILILSGSDELIHGFRQNSYLKTFEEIEDEQMIHLFPEFAQLTPSPAISIAFAYHVGANQVEQRWTACGCQDGQLQVFLVDTFKRELLMQFEDLESDVTKL